MALTCRTFGTIKNIRKSFLIALQQRKLSRDDSHSPKVLYRSYANTSPIEGSDKKQRDPALFFFDEHIQSRLLELNMRDTSKVFQARKEGQELSDPDLRFLTQEELEEEQAKAMATARYFLQVPPVLLAKKDEHVILSKDPALQGLEESKILFTDISFGVPHPDRLVVARDPDGTLRHASREERHRMIQAYFPEEARSYEIPQLFSPENLKSLLERSEFAYVLDRACIQFEPDDPDYIRITSTTYEYIDQTDKYDGLIGTRHYGSMAFYLIFNGKLDKLLNHCILTYKLQDAVTLVSIFYLTRPELNQKEPSTPDDDDFLKEYIQKYASEKEKPILTRTLNAYLELNLPTAAEE